MDRWRLLQNAEHVVAVTALLLFLKKIANEGFANLLFRGGIAVLSSIPGGKAIIENEQNAMLDDIRAQLEDASQGRLFLLVKSKNWEKYSQA
jgi:hypothetical protein